MLLLYLQNCLNNSKNQFIEMSLNEILYNFNIRDIFDFLFDLSSKYFNRLRLLKREQIEKFLIFVNIIIKVYYDKLYKLLNFVKKSIIYLRLYQNYEILNIINHKLHQ